MGRRFNFYEIVKGMNLGDPKVWNDRFEDLDMRLAGREADAATLLAAIDQLNDLGLARLNETFLPLIIEAQNRLNSLGASFNAESLSQITIASSGSMNVILTPETATNYVYTDYVSIRSAASPQNQMLCSVTSFTRSTGTLAVTILSAQGSGTFSDWLIRVGTPPETGHAERTDNPHHVTAEQVGTLTLNQIEQYVAGAISMIPGVDLSSRLAIAQNLADLSNKGQARLNLGLGDLATENMVGAGEIAPNLWASQAQAQAGTDNGAFMTALRVWQAFAVLLTDARIIAALGLTPVDQAAVNTAAANIQAWANGTFATLASVTGLMPAPTTATMPVGWSGMMAIQGYLTPMSTIAGNLVYSPGIAVGEITYGASQSGTWQNISGLYAMPGTVCLLRRIA